MICSWNLFHLLVIAKVAHKINHVKYFQLFNEGVKTSTALIVFGLKKENFWSKSSLKVQYHMSVLLEGRQGSVIFSDHIDTAS